jgi:23S rRNA (uracil1939-C5)-methyltransferase
MNTITLTTEKMTYKGAALARDEGRVIFVPYALPDERIRVRLRSTKKGWAQAELIEVLEASPERVEPACPHFGAQKCGGCHWQHADYEAQLRYKSEIVREQLQRIGRIKEPPVRACLGMEEPWHYRNHVQLRQSPAGLGFGRADHDGIYAIDSCLIMNQATHELFEATQRLEDPKLKRLVLRGSDETGERLAILEDGKSDTLINLLPADCAVAKRDRKGRVCSIRGQVSYHEQLGGKQWRIHANSFFQINTRQAEHLLTVVKELAGPFTGNETLLDAYAGVGLFGLSLAEKVGRVFLLESHAKAIADARQNASALGQVASEVTIIHGTIEEALSNWADYGPSPDILLLDPPRTGCKKNVLSILGKMAIPTIIYLSCDPSTQARDIHELLEQGYTLEAVQPVDLFPQTYHIESIALLRSGQ